MTSFNISNPGLKFKKPVTTSIASVAKMDKGQSIVLDIYPDLTIEIDKKKPALTEGQTVTLTPSDKSTYVLSVEGPAKSEKAPARVKKPVGASPEMGFKISNELK